MATERDCKTECAENFEWNVENEIRLFEAMIGYKPVGVHKHFHMACICEKFETLLGRPISPDVIWDHLGDMYDLAALDKKESVQFPNIIEEFTLPTPDFSALMAEKLLKTELANEVSVKEEKNALKTPKDSSHGGESVKREKKIEQDENDSEVEKRESDDTETPEVKRGKIKKEEKSSGKRGKRSTKDRKNNEDNAQVSTPNLKKGDEQSSSPHSNKKGKRIMGKRSLRSRTDDTPSKSSTPPPTKRARRI